MWYRFVSSDRCRTYHRLHSIFMETLKLNFEFCTLVAFLQTKAHTHYLSMWWRCIAHDVRNFLFLSLSYSICASDNNIRCVWREMCENLKWREKKENENSRHKLNADIEKRWFIHELCSNVHFSLAIHWRKRHQIRIHVNDKADLLRFMFKKRWMHATKYQQNTSNHKNHILVVWISCCYFFPSRFFSDFSTAFFPFLPAVQILRLFFFFFSLSLHI